MRFPICCFVAVVAVCAWSSVAPADSPDFNSYQYVFGQDAYTVMPGGTVDIPIYFQETVGLQDTSVLCPGGVGLVGAGVKVLFSDLPQPTQPARVLNVSDIVPNAAFDVPTPLLQFASAKLALGTLVGPSVHGDEFSEGVYRVLLGTFRFTAGEMPGETTPIRATDFDTGLSMFVTGDIETLDASPMPDARATISVVPEPGTLALLVVAVSVGLVWRNKRGA
jgi:hypothetical protein